MNNESWIDEKLDALRHQHLYRQAVVYPGTGGVVNIDGQTCLNFSSNDYLDLTQHKTVRAASAKALETYGPGSTASRLIVGSLPCHEELEQALAQYKGYNSALVFGSGYMTNAGIIPSLVGRDDQVFADRLSHASLVDAIQLSGAKLHRFKHNDVDHLGELLHKAPARGKRLVVSESVFSMDGDLAPLPALASLASKHDAMLMVDEAHATGVYGPNGSGLVRWLGLEGVVNLSMGTMSKGLAGYGGFVACSDRMRNYLVNHARAFIYTTAPPPAVVGAALGALDVLQKEPGLGAKLLERATVFRDRLAGAGLDTMDSASQIIPVRVGENEKAVLLSKRLREKGILALPIRPPTVPKGEARIRFSLTLAHQPADLEKTADTLIQLAREEQLI